MLAIKGFGEECCEGRRLKHESQRPRQQAKKSRKRKRKEARNDDEDDEDGGVKLQKADDGTALPAFDTAAVDVNAHEAGRGIGDHNTTLNGDAHGAVEVEDDAIGSSEHGGVPLPAQDHETADTNGEHKHHTIEPQTNGEQPPWQPKFRILDALSATGLRALRYASEIPFATAVTANDMDRKATNSIKVNVEHNKLSNIITTNTGNAIAYMYNAAFPPNDSHGPHHVNTKFDVIDLDPYGTAAPFIDSALQALNDEGLLCVTCTDSGVFASCGYPEKTFSLYGGMPIKGTHSHEGGLRLVLQSIASTAAKYGLAIEPLLSLSIDFYVRLFIRVRRSPAEVKFLAGKSMLVYGCDAGCGAWTTQMLGRNVRQTGKGGGQLFYKHSIAQAPSADRFCEHCGSKTHVAGPMWGGPIHNAAFIEKIMSYLKDADQEVYQTKPRIEGMLDTALDELLVVPNDVWQTIKREDGSRELLPKTPPELLDNHPFFFIPSVLSKVIHCQAPSEAAMKGALRHAGYVATRSHCKPGSIKTDAPWSVVWEIMREWVRQKAPIKEGALKVGAAGWNIMQAARRQPDESRSVEEGDLAGEAGALDSANEETAVVKKEQQTEQKMLKVVFDEVLGKDRPGKRLVRYQQNPRENWGPMARAKGSA